VTGLQVRRAEDRLAGRIDSEVAGRLGRVVQVPAPGTGHPVPS
jgi:hypothetical protein